MRRWPNRYTAMQAPPTILSLVLTRGGWLLTALLSLDFLPASAGTEAGTIRWSELGALIVGRRVSVPLAGGVVVEGDALSVRDDCLMLNIGKTSDARQYSRGQTLIPRTYVTEVQVTEHRGPGGRILGSVLGILIGLVAGLEVALHGTHSESAGVPTFFAVSAACTLGGYCFGKRADRHSTRLRIAPATDEGACPNRELSRFDNEMVKKP
jgi:hypothetical protein